MDIKLKELEKKNKNEQENLKRTTETTVPNSINLLGLIYEIELKRVLVHHLVKKLTDSQLNIFHPPQLV